MMQIVIGPGGQARCLYGEDINLAAIGQLQIRRASHVEPTAGGKWLADLSPAGGPQLGPFDRRSQALAAEIRWLEQNWLIGRQPN